ncbi:MAG TPA: hypothetical protein VFA59_23990 [Vicinamibacterales bacterium]|nr:hypothetical protein [Vicinamibacterales bacterium]
MDRHARRFAYASLSAFAIAFGWIEGTAVVYLREIYARELSANASAIGNLPIALVSLPGSLVAVEMMREACTIVLLAAVAWLAGRHIADRSGAFLFSFGLWDLTYYVALRAIAGWPDHLSTWDILFLIPSPWVAPVWAPVVVASLFVIGGTYLYWTAGRDRWYRWIDGAVLTAAALVTIAAFLFGSTAVIDHRIPDSFPTWVFWAGILLGAGWFVWIERTSVRSDDRLDVLLHDARDLGERFNRFGHDLSTHPDRVMVGMPDVQVAALTGEIHHLCDEVKDLEERLTLAGHATVVEQPDGHVH